ncbi:hypothetical protein B0H17DRAFT_634718 [Mycena rosella]|uniref:Uncharacterized protein n=1 Tax=Mycena rosella TaxID=1033263 RepID=A0AAD7DET1_MYCRO|nr:hypothetical protein B0H17DRAFT_634718 [Mycena rosella]
MTGGGSPCRPYAPSAPPLSAGHTSGFLCGAGKYLGRIGSWTRRRRPWTRRHRLLSTHGSVSSVSTSIHLRAPLSFFQLTRHQAELEAKGADVNHDNLSQTLLRVAARITTLLVAPGRDVTFCALGSDLSRARPTEVCRGLHSAPTRRVRRSEGGVGTDPSIRVSTPYKATSVSGCPGAPHSSVPFSRIGRGLHKSCR